MGIPAGAFVVGVGPGDPELLTLRAARVLEQCDLILHPGPRDREGIAVAVVAGLLRPDQRGRGMALAMRRGADDGSVGYYRVAAALAEEARAGRPAAFLTEGDPMLFGTGSYVCERLRALEPEVPVEVVPGVSALGAVAARLGWPLARKEDVLTVCPASYHAEEIGAILDRGGPVCWLKVAGSLPRLVEALRARSRLDHAVLVERVGHPDERIFRDLAAAQGEDLSYFSLVLVR
jgi:precorrin-2/cobalt-factor-2 C20-methyltransferase